jgi:hypothetical protein
VLNEKYDIAMIVHGRRILFVQRPCCLLVSQGIRWHSFLIASLVIASASDEWVDRSLSMSSNVNTR